MVCELRWDLEISLAKLLKNVLGAGAPVSESETPLLENSMALERLFPFIVLMSAPMSATVKYRVAVVETIATICHD